MGELESCEGLNVVARDGPGAGMERGESEDREKGIKQTSRKEKTTSSMVQSEFEYTTRMINTNLSNFSAWHNRSKLIPRLLDERGADHGARRKMLDDGSRSLCFLFTLHCLLLLLDPSLQKTTRLL